MAENLFIPENGTKTEKYEALLPQLEALVEGEIDLTANLANVSSALHQVFFWWWVFILSWTEVRLFLMSLSILCEYYELLF